MQRELVIVPCISVHPNQINLYGQAHWTGGKPKGRTRAEMISIDNSHKGVISKTAKQKVFRAIDYLLYNAKPKSAYNSFNGKLFKFSIAFITLTLSSKQIHSDNVIKNKLLNQFLIELYYKFKVSNYVWRAEKQANGSIHFHILINKFIPWSEIRNCWNRIQNKLGYVDRYRDEMKKFHEGGFKVRNDLLIQ